MNTIEINPQVEAIILQVANVASYLWDRGWAERNAGNISVNIDHLVDKERCNTEGFPEHALPERYPQLAGKCFFVTGTGKRMRDLPKAPLENALIVQITATGSAYRILSNSPNTEPFLPTSELPTHLAIHQQITERGRKEKVIIHTHANEIVALTHNPKLKTKEAINKLIWGMHPETMVFISKGVGFVPYVMPGSVEIAKQTLLEFHDHDVVLWEKHGIFAIGEEVEDTFDSIDLVSKSAKIWFACKQAGFEPEGLTNEQLAELKATNGS